MSGGFFFLSFFAAKLMAVAACMFGESWEEERGEGNCQHEVQIYHEACRM